MEKLFENRDGAILVGGVPDPSMSLILSTLTMCGDHADAIGIPRFRRIGTIRRRGEVLHASTTGLLVAVSPAAPGA